MTASFVRPGGSPVIVEATKVDLAFDAPVLSGVDLELQEGAELALLGRSGSGKTSLLLVLGGLVGPTGGSVTWPGLCHDPARRRAEIAMVFQAPSLFPELTVIENVCLPLRLRDVPEPEAKKEAMASLELVDAEATVDALPAELSGGQQQRAAVARALAGRPRLILADEPTGALDREHARQVLSALRARSADVGACLVVATHDIELADMLNARAWIEDGALRRAT
jgi:ABC-type lipoprotein export system ATPase subunit